MMQFLGSLLTFLPLLALLALLLGVLVLARCSREEPAAPPGAPWAGRTSCYRHIRAHLDPAGGLGPAGEQLPDEELAAKNSPLRWAPGAKDGVLGHHVGEGKKEVEELFAALRAAVRRADGAGRAVLYPLLLKHPALGYVDPLLEQVAASDALDPARLYELALWLATEAPDREPVKVGLALLGIIQGPESRALFLTLGAHEEFTLFSAVALLRTEEQPDAALWELARKVRGWGRIHAVERLAATKDPRIKDWLLREGFRNTVMDEYLAGICARAGDLPAALDQEEPDDGLLDAAGAIVEALIRGGPAEDLDDYEDGAEVVERLLYHLNARAPTPRRRRTVEALREFLQDERADWAAREKRGWPPEKRSLLLERCVEIGERPAPRP